MRRLNKNSGDPPRYSDLGDNDGSRDQQTRFGLTPLKLMGGLVVCLMLLSVLFSISVIFKDSNLNGIWAVADARVLDTVPTRDLGEEDVPLESFVQPKKKLHFSGLEHDDKLLGGLLSNQFDDESCLSRYQAASYRKDSPYKPSSYLISRLRRYEALHKRCGPYTESYNRTVANLRSGGKPDEASDCNYLVWVSFSGLGNRILTLSSAFLYALLTDRVLLVDRGVDMADLFCEPFPEASWLLPLDFPITDRFKSLNQESPECFGNMVKLSSNSSTLLSSSYVYLHLVHDYNDHDKLFFCDQDQSFLQKVPWVIMKSDNYFIPSLFLMPTFEQELHSLFPEKETVFHFLGRYLFFPTNPIWGLITRYYQAYLAQADERIGVQVRVFDTRPGPFEYVLDQILACSLDNDLLPEINPNKSFVASSGNQKSKAVLLTSLSSGYFEKIRDMYWEHPTVTGEVIEVFQPSHEGYQQTEKKMHHRKAWAEMYLLSLTDKLITSSWSTFGYVAQSLGGLKPWILYKPENETTPNPACTRAMSIEPCFHAPPFFDCKKRTGIDTGEVVPHVRHCEDMAWGLKLVDPAINSIA
ncbi:hypothetical protein OSB04_013706 [Centaurea solstitialis]|uniref:Fucosyltransferase n=1 Tax=Centaurea solstitialis TaxID=347529 RepID=A0AA38TWT8_9ASTR|nr:hypothetical protein OSB04_013706 [Centaurea solstitialis]